MSFPRIALGIALLSSFGVHAIAQTWPVSRAEKSNYRETSHYSDVIDFIHDLQKAGAPISLHTIGKSMEGKPMPLVVASIPPVSSAAEARRLGKPIVYIQANIHAGEVEGKEAVLAILRRLSQEGSKGLLSKLVLLVDPIYNIDGNEKFGPVEVNRPEQDGPDVVGVRPNGQGFDLNRDAIKAESPETRAVLANIYNTWDPDVMMDLHTTDGTRHGWELTYAPPMNPNTDPDVMHFTRDVLLPHVRKELASKFGMLTFDYGNVEARRGEKTRAWYTYGQEGRYCTHYVGIRGRISILSEATTFIPFKDRVVGTDRFVTAILEYVAAHSKQVLSLTKAADAKVVSWGQNPATAPELGVRFDFALRGEETVPLEHREANDKSVPFGRPKKLDQVKLPIFDRFKVTRTAKFPAAYLIPPTATDTVALLVRHGVRVERLTANWTGPASTFQIEKLTPGRAFQGHPMIGLEGKFTTGAATAEAGTFIVRTAQPLGALAFHILEPESLDGAATWGFLGKLLSAEMPYPILKAFEPILEPTEVVK